MIHKKPFWLSLHNQSTCEYFFFSIRDENTFSSLFFLCVNVKFFSFGCLGELCQKKKKKMHKHTYEKLNWEEENCYFQFAYFCQLNIACEIEILCKTGSKVNKTFCLLCWKILKFIHHKLQVNWDETSKWFKFFLKNALIEFFIPFLIKLKIENTFQSSKNCSIIFPFSKSKLNPENVSLNTS